MTCHDWTCKSASQNNTDRKSTRLNSSHDQISYAVFCLKKKKNRRSIGSVVTAATRPFWGAVADELVLHYSSAQPDCCGPVQVWGTELRAWSRDILLAPP